MSNFAKEQIWDGTNTAKVDATQALAVKDQTLEVLNEILAQLQLLNMNFAGCAPSAHVDQDASLADNMPTS